MNVVIPVLNKLRWVVGAVVVILISACSSQTGANDIVTEQATQEAATEVEATDVPIDTVTPPPPATPTFDAVGRDIFVELPAGDAARGARYWEEKRWECSGCHELLQVGPPLEGDEARPGIATIAAERLQDPGYDGQAQTAEEYLFEAIVLPGAYVVDGYADGLMPDRLGDLLTAQEVADMIAFLMTLE